MFTWLHDKSPHDIVVSEFSEHTRLMEGILQDDATVCGRSVSFIGRCGGKRNLRKRRYTRLRRYIANIATKFIRLFLFIITDTKQKSTLVK